MAARVAVLVSGAGTNLQALLDAAADPGYGVEVVVVGADRHDTAGVQRAVAAGVATFVVRLEDAPDRATFDERTAAALAEQAPDLVVCAGYMKLLGPAVLERFPQRIVNTHPALLPAFPGAHAVRDALAFGAKVTGSTVHVVDELVDHGPVVAQVAVAVEPDDDEAALHARIKDVEAPLLVDAVRRLARGFRVDGRRVVFDDDAPTRTASPPDPAPHHEVEVSL